MDVIAEDRIDILYPDGELRQVHLRIGRPHPNSKGKVEWGCQIQAEGLRIWEGPTELFGVSSLHALMIGVGFLRRMLTIEVDRGAVLHWQGETEPLHVDYLFAMKS
jgi:hypothetical protein